jgi:hypothetical protein
MMMIIKYQIQNIMSQIATRTKMHFTVIILGKIIPKYFEKLILKTVLLWKDIDEGSSILGHQSLAEFLIGWVQE